ncbi:twin-arginine translocase TatA/TatE family subunit [Sphingopyxis indica]|uniref:Sec-independent protein translocase protein TatA n=1 Tax=Sphingopyxis indica TaxID=436663 RepID=A0A239DQ69_9SPHN|nr:twin-arginine translocase TatA/TatE family subunit [Sphingopyxis indica]WOF44812.1 twin-arginine translocase TatA/TatE family subunit [Sphingopyxis indica]SNS33883.1 sec-independent protein translocase protein TatA [Sphingopyxis indica]
MGGLSIWHWLIVGILVLLLFGKGRFSDMMGDVAKGIKSFKKGMSEDEETPPSPAPRQIEGQRAPDVPPAATPAPTAETDRR